MNGVFMKKFTLVSLLALALLGSINLVAMDSGSESEEDKPNISALTLEPAKKRRKTENTTTTTTTTSTATQQLTNQLPEFFTKQQLIDFLNETKKRQIINAQPNINLLQPAYEKYQQTDTMLPISYEEIKNNLCPLLKLPDPVINLIASYLIYAPFETEKELDQNMRNTLKFFATCRFLNKVFKPCTDLSHLLDAKIKFLTASQENTPVDQRRYTLNCSQGHRIIASALANLKRVFLQHQHNNNDTQILDNYITSLRKDLRGHCPLCNFTTRQAFYTLNDVKPNLSMHFKTMHRQSSFDFDQDPNRYIRID